VCSLKSRVEKLDAESLNPGSIEYTSLNLGSREYIVQVRSLKSGSIVFPLVTFSRNENTLHVTNTDNIDTQTLQNILSKTQVGNPFLSLQLS